MVAMYVNGVKVGTMEDAAVLLPKFLAERQTVKFCDETGGWTISELRPAPLHPLDPTLSRDDWDRIAGEPGGSSLAEIKKRWGME
jgi:hypothetical protein